MRKLCILLLSLCLVNLAFGKIDGLEKATQKGVGTISTTVSHGKTMYVFVPNEPNTDKLRKVKMHKSKMGFKKGFPKELEKFFKEALENEYEVEIECEFYDKGLGKATSIGFKLISYKKV